MNSLMFKVLVFAFSLACTLHAAPDISNLSNCIKDVQKAQNTVSAVPTFDPYKANYKKLIADLEAAAATLPYVYQEAASKPVIQFLKALGEKQYLKIFERAPRDEQTALYQEIIPDVVLAILFHKDVYSKQVNVFQEIVSDLYDSFLSEEARVGKATGRTIEPPTYGVIPPLVKFGNQDYGPYTWPADATSQVFGMKCAVVSLPPSQLNGGLLAWTTLGHETGGHDVTHADKGLLDELGQKVYNAVYAKFKSTSLANYWRQCIDEASADVLGYLHMGPTAGIGLIGYFRALTGGKLRSVGSQDDPHPIDLLRGYLAASVVKRLHFKDAVIWSQVITNETRKDNDTLYLTDRFGFYHRFPASLDSAIVSADVVAEVILRSKLTSLQGYSIQDIQDWTDADQEIVNTLTSALRTTGQLPANIAGPGFFAAHVVAATTQVALERGSNVATLFGEMQDYLASMHSENPIWSSEVTTESLAFLEYHSRGEEQRTGEIKQRLIFPQQSFEKLVNGEPELLLASEG